jgi:Ni2+-binding GTPase involved in maturation of urease and hydrogenase
MALIVQISGFLGSGKTSTIIKLATAVHQRMGSKVAVIVNEIGDVDVDGEFVKGSGLYSRRLLGGCICCSLGNDLVSTIKSVIEEYDPEVLFVEPTGVALPSQVRGYFVQASYILAGLEFSPVVTLVDGSRFKFLLREFRPFFTKQMRDADILVVTKIDKLDKKFELPLIVSALRETHPKARIIGTSTVTGEGLDELLQEVITGRMARVVSLTAAEAITNSVRGSEVGSADFYGRFSLTNAVSGSEIKGMVGEIMIGIGSRCKALVGNLIGHIKAYVSAGDSGFKASLVDLSSGVEFSNEIPTTLKEFKASIFVALSGLEQKILEQILKEEIEKIMSKYGVVVEDLHHR